MTTMEKTEINLRRRHVIERFGAFRSHIMSAKLKLTFIVTFLLI